MSTVADRVKETSTTTGTGNLTLAGAATGYQTFNTAFGTQVFFPYVIALGSEWEVGDGYLSGAATLVRARPKDGSAAVPVSFSAGAKDVLCSAAAEYLRAPDPSTIYGVPLYLP